MRIKSLFKVCCISVLLLMTAHCRASKQPLLTCQEGDPTCDFDQERTDGNQGKDNDDANSKSTPQLSSKATQTTGETDITEGDATDATELAADADEDTSSVEQTTVNNSTASSTNALESPVTAVESGVEVKLTLAKNEKNGAEFYLTYIPYGDVIHKSFSIGDLTRDTVEHKFSGTNFAKKVSLNNLMLPVRAEYQYKDSTYCAHWQLNDAFSDPEKSHPQKATSSPGACPQ